MTDNAEFESYDNLFDLNSNIHLQIEAGVSFLSFEYYFNITCHCDVLSFQSLVSIWTTAGTGQLQLSIAPNSLAS